LIERFGVESEVFLSMNTAGKALGASGAFVAGDAWAIEYLVQKARSFIFSTAPLPAIADALKTAIEIVREENQRREKLLNLSEFFRQLLNENGIKVSFENSQIVPIVIGESKKAVKIAAALQTRGFDVRAVRPPTVPANTARLRVSLNVGLTEEILRQFVDNLTRVISEN
jgi:8-amino-7-oxononanoate synthase